MNPAEILFQMNYQKLKMAQSKFDEAANYACNNSAVNLLGEGLALLTEALSESPGDKKPTRKIKRFPRKS